MHANKLLILIPSWKQITEPIKTYYRTGRGSGKELQVEIFFFKNLPVRRTPGGTKTTTGAAPDKIYIIKVTNSIRTELKLLRKISLTLLTWRHSIWTVLETIKVLKKEFLKKTTLTCAQIMGVLYQLWTIRMMSITTSTLTPIFISLKVHQTKSYTPEMYIQTLLSHINPEISLTWFILTIYQTLICSEICRRNCSLSLRITT